STLVTMDFVQKLRPGMTSKQLVRAGQITTLVLVVLASLWAPMIERFDSLWEYLQIILSYIAPPVAATFLVGLFWKRSNSQGAIAGLLTGFLVSIVMVIALVTGGAAEEAGTEPAGWVNFLNSIHFLHFTAYLFVTCALVNIVVSLMTPPQAEGFQRTASVDDAADMEGVEVGDLIEDQRSNYIWRSSLFTDETKELESVPWYLNYRYLSVLLLIITAIVVGYFW
ncbi:MAG: hypothetical protein AAFO94_03020, partial [Bacteroidota bacterium]